MATRDIRIIIPVTVWEKLDKIERKTGVTKEDLIMRAIVRIIEEFEGG